MKKDTQKKVLKIQMKEMNEGNCGPKKTDSVVSEYHASKGTKGSIINKALGGRFG